MAKTIGGVPGKRDIHFFTYPIVVSPTLGEPTSSTARHDSRD